jgi:ABC-type glutathione transport system ATPase component
LATDSAAARPDPAGPEASGPDAAAPLLEIRDLRVHYRAPALFGRGGPPVRAVDGVTLSLRRGATLGLVGESGSGKTTLAKSLIRLEPVTSGEIIFGGQDIAAMTERAFTPVRRRIQMVFQDSLNSLNPRFTLADTLAEPFIVHKLAPRAAARQGGGAAAAGRPQPGDDGPAGHPPQWRAAAAGQHRPGAGAGAGRHRGR